MFNVSYYLPVVDVDMVSVADNQLDSLDVVVQLDVVESFLKIIKIRSIY